MRKRKVLGDRYRFEMSETEYARNLDEMIGLCLACGGERETCEPDAKRYRCHTCGLPEVYGTEELLMMGRIHFPA